MKAKLKRLKQILKSDKARPWWRALIVGIITMATITFFVIGVYYAILTGYIMRDGLDVVKTLPPELIEMDGANNLVDVTKELGEIATVAIFMMIVMFSAFMTRLGVGAINEELDATAERAREKKEKGE
jgi:hypothetical protein